MRDDRGQDVLDQRALALYDVLIFLTNTGEVRPYSWKIDRLFLTAPGGSSAVVSQRWRELCRSTFRFGVPAKHDFLWQGSW
jgi:hypothetical protein